MMPQYLVPLRWQDPENGQLCACDFGREIIGRVRSLLENDIGVEFSVINSAALRAGYAAHANADRRVEFVLSMEMLTLVFPESELDKVFTAEERAEKYTLQPQFSLRKVLHS